VANKIKYILGFLIVVILTSSVYILLENQVRIDVEKTKTTIKVYEDGSWELGGTERTILYDGTTKMRASSRDINYSIDGNKTTIVRTAYFKEGIIAIDTYDFDGTTKDVALYPIKHKINILNAKNKILHYEVNDLGYKGLTIKDIKSPMLFDHNVKIEWDAGNYYSKIYKYANKDIGKLIVRYRINSNDFTTYARMFDPPGDYTGVSWNYSAETTTAYGIANNGTYFWVVDKDNTEVFKYWINGTYTGSHFDTSGHGSTNYGITTNNTYIWISNIGSDEVYKYQMDGTYVDSFDTNACGNTDLRGITTNNTYLWTVDFAGNKTYKYQMDGTPINSFSLAGQSNNSYGITIYDDYLLVGNPVNNLLYRYWTNGTYVGTSIDTSGEMTNPRGLTNDGTYLWVLDGISVNGHVYKYYLIDTQCTPTLNQDWIITDAQTCDNEEVTTGTGLIVIQTGGNLTLINSANVTTSGINITKDGDAIFLYDNCNLFI